MHSNTENLGIEKSVTNETSFGDKQPNGYKVRPYMAIPRRGSRKKTLSLNPEEREALENLIEEVIMDGGIADSDSGSSDNEELSTSKNDLQKLGCNIDKSGKPVQKKYYPGQLKVALKHMSELPPRFSRKLKRAEKYLELNLAQKEAMAAVTRIEEEEEEEVKDEKRTSFNNPEKAKQEIKKNIRNLLTNLDQYVDEKDKTGFATPMNKISGAISCSEFEKEAFNVTKSSINVTSNSSNKDNINKNKNYIYNLGLTSVNQDSKAQSCNWINNRNRNSNNDTTHINVSTDSQSNYKPTIINSIPQTLYVAQVSATFDPQINLQYSHVYNKNLMPQVIPQQALPNSIGFNQSALNGTVPLMYPAMIMPSYGYQTDMLQQNNYTLPNSNILHQQIMYPPPNYSSIQTYYPLDNQFNMQFTKPPPSLPISYYNVNNYSEINTLVNHSQMNQNFTNHNKELSPNILDKKSVSNINFSSSIINHVASNINTADNLHSNENVYKKEISFKNLDSKSRNRKTQISTKLFEKSDIENLDHTNKNNSLKTEVSNPQFASTQTNLQSSKIFTVANNSTTFHSTYTNDALQKAKIDGNLIVNLNDRPILTKKNRPNFDKKNINERSSPETSIIDQKNTFNSNNLGDINLKKSFISNSSILNTRINSIRPKKTNFNFDSLKQSLTFDEKLTMNNFISMNDNLPVEGDVTNITKCDIDLMEGENSLREDIMYNNNRDCDSEGLNVTLSSDFVHRLNKLFKISDNHISNKEKHNLYLKKEQLETLFEALNKESS